MTQAQAVIETIEMLGGIATLNQINQHIFKIADCKWRTKLRLQAYLLFSISQKHVMLCNLFIIKRIVGGANLALPILRAIG